MVIAQEAINGNEGVSHGYFVDGRKADHSVFMMKGERTLE